MGQYATNADMKPLVNFHYSDFWADPAKQAAPKAWQSLTVNEKADALAAYCGESEWKDICTLLSAGTSATRDISEDIRIAIHFTNPERTGSYDSYASYLDTYGVGYDIFASSYYSYWHGTTDNLTSELGNIADKYGKQVMVAEPPWVYTLKDGDGHSNTVKEGSNNRNQPYEFSVQEPTHLSRSPSFQQTTKQLKTLLIYWQSPVLRKN